MTKAHALSRDELIAALTVYSGTTSGDGAAGGTTLVDAALIGATDYVTGKTVIFIDGDCIYETREATAFAPLTGTITFDVTNGGQVVAGTNYKLLNIPNGLSVAAIAAAVAALQADVGDASTSTLGSLYAILGNPAQTFLAMIGYEGATALADKLTAARAALIDEITALRMAELDAANLPADIDTINTNQGDPSGDTLTSTTAKLGNLARSLATILGTRWNGAGDLGTDIAAIISALATIAGYLDTEIADLVTELAKVPKSDGTASWNATALQAIQDEAEDALEGENLDHLLAATDGAGNFPNTAVDGSVISKILSKVAGGDTSSYDETTDSLEAISDSVTAVKTQTDKLSGAAPAANSVIANWQSGTGTSGETGADLITIGANDTKNKVLSLDVDISALTDLSVITIRMYKQVNGVEKKCYEQQFTAGVDPDDCWVINGTVGIHEALRVEVQSDTAADNGLAVAYDYMLEAM